MKNWLENRGKYRVTEIIFGLIHVIGFFLLPHLRYGLASLNGLYDAAAGLAGLSGMDSSGVVGIPKNITGLNLLTLQGVSELEEISIFGYILLFGAILGAAMILMHCFGKGKLSYAMTIVISVIHHAIYIPAFVLSVILAGASFGAFKAGMAGPVLIIISLAEFVLAIVGLVKDGKQVSSSVKRRAHGKNEGMLIGMEGAWEGAFIPLRDGETILIGRDPQVCQIVLKGSNISRKHCAVRYNATEGSYCVTDYSSNGVYDQEGRRLHKGTVDILHGKDEIRFGMPVNVFRFGEAS